MIEQKSVQKEISMRIHGNYKIKQKGQTLYSTLIGAWNAECAEKFSKEIKKTILSICNKPWIEISDLTEWGHCTPEADLFLLELFKWRFNHNLKLHIIIQPNTIVEKKIKELPSIGKIIICQSAQDAHEYIQQLDFT